MQESWRSFEISLPVDPAAQRLLRTLPLVLGCLSAAWLVAFLEGWQQALALLPIASGATARWRLRRLETAPERVRFSVPNGWQLISGEAERAVVLEPGSHIGHRVLLLAFRSASGRRWLVLCLQRRRAASAAWRRLRVLRRAAPGLLVRNWTNC